MKILFTWTLKTKDKINITTTVPVEALNAYYCRESTTPPHPIFDLKVIKYTYPNPTLESKSLEAPKI